MDIDQQNDDFVRLHRLITASGDLKGFLDGMSCYVAQTLSGATGTRVECAVTLQRSKRPVVHCGSCDDAVLLHGVEQALGEGPSRLALETSAPVIIADAGAEQRWPEYCKDLATESIRSVLAVPLPVRDDATAVLSFFAAEPHTFTNDAVEVASRFAEAAAHALVLALRITTADLLADDLKAAMERRTAIDLACGIIMAQNNCTQAEAFEFLHRASQNRNQKLHDIAENIITSHTGNNSGQNGVTTVFND